MLPHMPWRFLPSGRSYFAYDHAPRGLLRRDKSGRRSWGNDAWLIVLAEQRHLLQLAYTDRLVGTLLARLRELGIFERAMIVIAADHGTAFVAGEPRRALEADNMSGILFVPLLVKLPGQRAGTIVDEPVSALDVMPTVAAVVELPIPWPVAGRSLLGSPRSAGSSFPLRSGSRRTLSWSEFETMLAHRNVRVSHKNEVFGQGEGLRKLFQIGATEAHAALIGRRVSDFAQAEAPSEQTGEDAHLPCKIASNHRQSDDCDQHHHPPYPGKSFSPDGVDESSRNDTGDPGQYRSGNKHDPNL